jgi:hypothetical protein
MKKSFSPRQKLVSDMSHATYTQGKLGDSWLLVVGNQIANLTLDLSFGHNLCLKCSNESHEPILNIYVLRDFLWYKELFNPMGFDSYNRFLKIWKSIRTLTPKVGTPLRVWGFIPSHSPTFLGTWDVIPGLHPWPAPLQALALVASPRLGLRHIQWVTNGHCNSKIKFKAS